jgi:hypothetical protein
MINASRRKDSAANVEQADPLFEFPNELIELVRTHGARHAFYVDEQKPRPHRMRQGTGFL